MASEKHNLSVHSSNISIGKTEMLMKSSFFNKSGGIQDSRVKDFLTQLAVQDRRAELASQLL